MSEKKVGRQTPTQSVVLPYKQTRGAEAVALYNESGRTAIPWQELLCYDIMAVDADGLWVHQKFGYSVPRRNGKNEVVVMRELWGRFYPESSKGIKTFGVKRCLFSSRFVSIITLF